MPSPCAAAPCLNVRSNAASRVALAPKTPWLVTALITALRRPWRGGRARASLPPNRLLLPGSRLMPGVNSGRRWTPTGRPAKNGSMLNWQMWQPPRRRLKKGAPNEPPGRNPPGSGIRDPSRIRPRLKVPLLRIPAPSGPTSPNAYCAKPRGEASRKPPVAWCWAMALPGSGIPPGTVSPKPLRFSNRYHAKEALHRTAQSIFGATSESKQWARARCTELDDGKLHAIVHALRDHSASCGEATKCALYIFHNRARMRYPKFRAQGFCTSTGVLEAGCKVAIAHPTSILKSWPNSATEGKNAMVGSLLRTKCEPTFAQAACRTRCWMVRSHPLMISWHSGEK